VGAEGSDALALTRSVSAALFLDSNGSSREESYQSGYDFAVSPSPVAIQPQIQSMTAHYRGCSSTGRKKIISRRGHSLVLAHRRQKFGATQKAHTNRTEPPSLPPTQTRSSTISSPEETVHIQTNRGDGYCPDAFIAYCPSP